MLYLSRLFIETTDPLTRYNRLYHMDVLLSICFHIVFYIFIIKLVTTALKIHISTDIYLNIIILLSLVMIIGYIARLTRVKSLYQVYLDRGMSAPKARQLSIDLLHKGYFTYYFLG